MYSSVDTINVYGIWVNINTISFISTKYKVKYIFVLIKTTLSLLLSHRHSRRQLTKSNSAQTTSLLLRRPNHQPQIQWRNNFVDICLINTWCTSVHYVDCRSNLLPTQLPHINAIRTVAGTIADLVSQFYNRNSFESVSVGYSKGWIWICIFQNQVFNWYIFRI